MKRIIWNAKDIQSHFGAIYRIIDKLFAITRCKNIAGWTLRKIISSNQKWQGFMWEFRTITLLDSFFTFVNVNKPIQQLEFWCISRWDARRNSIHLSSENKHDLGQNCYVYGLTIGR